MVLAHFLIDGDVGVDDVLACERRLAATTEIENSVIGLAESHVTIVFTIRGIVVILYIAQDDVVGSLACQVCFVVGKFISGVEREVPSVVFIILLDDEVWIAACVGSIDSAADCVEEDVVRICVIDREHVACTIVKELEEDWFAFVFFRLYELSAV